METGSFTENSAESGGAIYAVGDISVRKSRIINNTATENGGAIVSLANILLSYSILSKNTAKNGGAVWLTTGSLTAINSQFDNNTAESGGAIYLTCTASATLRNVTVTANSAVYGGGIFAESGAMADLYNTIIALNAVTEVTPNTGSASNFNNDVTAQIGAELNAYKVLSKYTDWTNRSEGAWTESSAFYPLFNEPTDDGVYTLNQSAFQVIDRGENIYAVDENGDLLTEDLLGLPRIVRTRYDSDEPIVDLGACENQQSEADNIQFVHTSEESLVLKVFPNETITPTIVHEVIKLYHDTDATTLSLRIHFNSDYLAFDSSNPGNYEMTDMTGEGNFNIYSDTEDYDGDSTTDCYILVTWNNPEKLWGGDDSVEICSPIIFTVSNDIDTTKDHTTYIRFSSANHSPNFQFLSCPIEIKINRVTFDVDGDGAVNISTDVNLVLRYMAGKTGEELTKNLTYEKSKRDDEQVKEFLDTYGFVFDIDGDGVFNAAVDGEILARYLAGFTGDELLSNISLTSAALRTDAATISTYIETYLTGVTQVDPTTDNAHVITPTVDIKNIDEKDNQIKVVAGEPFALNLAHTVKLSPDEPTDKTLTATTLSLRLYFNTRYFTIDTSSLGYYMPGLVGSSLKPYVIGTDTDNDDGDPSTDAWVQFTWNNQAGWTWSSQQINSLVNAVFTVNDFSADSDAGPIISTFHVTSLDRTPGFKMDDVDVDVQLIPSSFNSKSLWLFDIDGSGSVDIATDGTLLKRYVSFKKLMEVDDLLIDGVSTRCSQDDIFEYLWSYEKAFDIDGSGGEPTLEDVTYFLKFFSGYRGEALQIPNSSAPKTGDEIAAYIKRFIPENQRTDLPIAAAALPPARVIECALLSTGYDLMTENLAFSDDPVLEPSLMPQSSATVTVKASAAPSLAPMPFVSEAFKATSAPFASARPFAAAPLPEAAASVWEKPMDEDWFLPEIAPIEAGAVVFRPADEIAAFDFDPDWPDFF